MSLVCTNAGTRFATGSPRFRMRVVAASFKMVKAYPVEGDSAIAEVWCRGDDLDKGAEEHEWARLWLEDIDLAAVGRQRTANARVVVEIQPSVLLDGPPRMRKFLEPWQFDFDDARAQLERAAGCDWWWGFSVAEGLAELEDARDWLLENEHGRERLTDTEDLVPAAMAFSKVGKQEQARMSALTEPSSAGILRRMSRFLPRPRLNRQRR